MRNCSKIYLSTRWKVLAPIINRVEHDLRKKISTQIFFTKLRKSALRGII